MQKNNNFTLGEDTVEALKKINSIYRTQLLALHYNRMKYINANKRETPLVTSSEDLKMGNYTQFYMQSYARTVRYGY